MKQIYIHSRIRQGSGSACRSVLGGFVAWDMGKHENGTDSLARQVETEGFWPEMKILILVVSINGIQFYLLIF